MPEGVPGTPPSSAGGARRERVPEATVARLPVYHRCLAELHERGDATVSSERLAELAGVNAAKVRKDLSHLGSYGTRGVGYEVEYLLVEVERTLGRTHLSPVVIVGMGNLGRALASYDGFEEGGFPVVGLVDADPSKVGTEIAGLTVVAASELGGVVRERGAEVGIIATPAAAAQQVADALVEAGVRSILNFAPAVVSVPEHVPLRKVDVATELQILSFYAERTGPEPRTARRSAS
jgi:redox-sensing transcriptional repressor